MDRTESKTDTPVARGSSAAVLIKRNLAEQSKWLNDETGDRSWAKHETQTVEWMMGRQVKALAK
jgi:hypothetical protein